MPAPKKGDQSGSFETGSSGTKKDAEELASSISESASKATENSEATSKLPEELESFESEEDEEQDEFEDSENEEEEDEEIAAQDEVEDMMRSGSDTAAKVDAPLEDDDFDEEEDSEDMDEDEESEQQQDEDEDQGDYDPEFESGWEDDDDEESEEELDGAADDENADDEVESAVAQTVSTVSNEIEVKSDLEFYDLDRQPAHVFPEPPWGGVRDQAKQVMVSCLLPLLLVILLFYALLKCFQGLAQCLLDAFNVGSACLWLAIRVALSPLVLIWRLFVPSYLQRYASSQYDEKVGRRIRRLLYWKRRVIAAITDLPNVLVACSKAAWETCIMPARDHCGVSFWKYFGQYADRYLFKPIADANINRITKKRKSHVYSNKGDHDIKMIKKRQEQIARKQKREAREKAKKLRHKKRMQEMNVQLQVTMDHPAGALQQKHQFQDKKSTEMISRSMIVERRYAVAIGFFWCVIGFVLLIQVMDGTRGERCTICETNSEIQMQICRHGIGRDCAFNLHGAEIIVAIILMFMGVVLLVYSSFLYKPRGLGVESAEKERKEKLAEAEKKVSNPKQKEDNDTLVIADVRERMKQATLARIVRKVYMKSPCRSVQQICSRKSTRPLRYAMAWEDRHNLHQRSIRLQERALAWTAKFFGASRVPFLTEKKIPEREKVEEKETDDDDTAKPPEAEDEDLEPTEKEKRRASLLKTRKARPISQVNYDRARPPYMRVLIALAMPCIACGYAGAFVCQKTPFPRLFNKYIKPRLKKCCPRRFFSKTAGSFADDDLMDGRDSMSGVRGRGRAGGGVSTLEDVLRRFGFLTEEEQAALDAEKKGGQAQKIEAERKKLVVEKPDPLGHIETQREAGLNDVEEGGVGVEEDVPRSHPAWMLGMTTTQKGSRPEEDKDSSSSSSSAAQTVDQYGSSQYASGTGTGTGTGSGSESD